MAIRLLLGLLVVSGVGTGPDNEPAEKDLAAFQGRWQVVAREFDGERTEVHGGVVHTFRGDKWVIADQEVCRLRLDPTCTPKLLDCAQTTPGAEGVTLEGIYKIDGATLVICLQVQAQEVKQRPVDFQAERGSNHKVYWFRRVEP